MSDLSFRPSLRLSINCIWTLLVYHFDLCECTHWRECACLWIFMCWILEILKSVLFVCFIGYFTIDLNSPVSHASIGYAKVYQQSNCHVKHSCWQLVKLVFARYSQQIKHGWTGQYEMKLTVKNTNLDQLCNINA